MLSDLMIIFAILLAEIVCELYSPRGNVSVSPEVS